SGGVAAFAFPFRFHGLRVACPHRTDRKRSEAMLGLVLPFGWVVSIRRSRLADARRSQGVKHPVVATRGLGVSSGSCVFPDAAGLPCLTWPVANRIVVSWIWTICCPAAYFSPCALDSSLSITVVMKLPRELMKLRPGTRKPTLRGQSAYQLPTRQNFSCQGAPVSGWLGKIFTITKHISQMSISWSIAIGSSFAVATSVQVEQSGCSARSNVSGSKPERPEKDPR